MLRTLMQIYVKGSVEAVDIYQKAFNEINVSKTEINVPYQLMESQIVKLKSINKLINKLEFSLDYLIKHL